MRRCSWAAAQCSRWVCAARARRTCGSTTADTSGAIVVSNKCVNTSVSPSTTFRKINVTLNRLALNQGYMGMPFFARNATLASAWLSVDQPPRSTDSVQARHCATGNGAGGQVIKGVVLSPIGHRHFAVHVGGQCRTPFLCRHANALNLPNVIYDGTGPTEARLEIVKSGRVVASSPSVETFRAGLCAARAAGAHHARWLLGAAVEPDEIDRRCEPGGLSLSHLPRRAEAIWSDEVIVQSRVTPTPYRSPSAMAASRPNAGG